MGMPAAIFIWPRIHGIHGIRVIIVVSDLHAGHPDADVPAFLGLLDACASHEPGTLVLLGDIFDFWRRRNGPLMLEQSALIERLIALEGWRVHCVAGNHDYALLAMSARWGERGPFPITKRLRLEEAGRTTLFVHGYELEVYGAFEPLSVEGYEKLSERLCAMGDISGTVTGRIYDLYAGGLDLSGRADALRRPPGERESVGAAGDLADSPARHLVLGMEHGDRLVYGHTHRPKVSKDGLVANSGSWIGEGDDSRTYLRIEDDRVALRRWGRDPFP